MSLFKSNPVIHSFRRQDCSSPSLYRLQRVSARRRSPNAVCEARVSGLDRRQPALTSGLWNRLTSCYPIDDEEPCSGCFAAGN